MEAGKEPKDLELDLKPNHRLPKRNSLDELMAEIARDGMPIDSPGFIQITTTIPNESKPGASSPTDTNKSENK